MNALTAADWEQFRSSNRSIELIQRHYEFLVHGTALQKDLKAATLRDGIEKLDPEAEAAALARYHQQKDTKTWMKFVPASGAASRMFAPFFAFQQAAKKPTFDFETYCNSKEGSAVKRLFTALKRLPFYTSVYAKIVQDSSIPMVSDLDFFTAFVSFVLEDKGLAYPKLPKALIPFFVDEKTNQWTAFEAQLLEAFQLGDPHQATPIHLTIDKEHRSLFEAAEATFRAKLTAAQQQIFRVEYSYQHPLTDTPYLVGEQDWGRDENGTIAFRKGGHGALLENLNRLEADLIWIKNIDNILLNQDNAESEHWMKILAGHLLGVQEQLFAHLTALDTLKTQADFDRMVSFIQKYFDPTYTLVASSKMPNEILYDYLDRPLRICGMIPNEGAKGGGPFWKKDARGKSLQIIEGVELDPEDKTHRKAIQQSSHFNPVMMVCGITDHRGKKYSLYEFRDEKRFMVSQKTLGASQIKILEWPGLWNGGMAAWNTLFIELPATTFNPVKTIADLIR